MRIEEFAVTSREVTIRPFARQIPVQTVTLALIGLTWRLVPDAVTAFFLVVVGAASVAEFAPVADATLPVVTIDDDEPITEEPEDILPDSDDDDDEPTVDADSVALTAHSFCSAVQVFWTPEVGTAVDTFELAVQVNEAAWDMDSLEPQPGSSDGMTLGSLANGTYSFQVRATLDDGSVVDSDIFTTEVIECAPIEPQPEPQPEPQLEPGS